MELFIWVVVILALVIGLVKSRLELERAREDLEETRKIIDDYYS